MRKLLLALVLVLAVPSAQALVMNENPDRLPPGCDEVAGWENITVEAGKEVAEEFPGTMFTYDRRSFDFEPCTRLTVTLVNHDEVRHQWMVHDLPTETYPMGMFNVEVTGPGNETGTFILPSYEETLLVHCGVPQHMEKGMKAQLKVGEGHGDLANIPGLTADPYRYDYAQEDVLPAKLVLAAVGAVVGGLVAVLLLR